MPLRTEPSNSMSQDVLYHCISPSTTHGILFAGAARLFTAIDPISAGVTGLIMPITDYVLDKIVPNFNVMRNHSQNELLKYVVTRLGGYAAATAAANALGYSISFGKILVLSACTNILMVGVGIIVFLVAKRIFPSVENFGDQFVGIGIGAGIPLIALLGGAIGDAINDTINEGCCSGAQQGGQGAEGPDEVA